jgi:short-subunit dehydrogenase
LQGAAASDVFGSSIINTASIQSFDPGPELIAYASTKSAIASFTNSLAGLVMKRGVRVNAVAPFCHALSCNFVV